MSKFWILKTGHGNYLHEGESAPSEFGWREVVFVDQLVQVKADAARFRWHLKHNSSALLATAWSKSTEACAVSDVVVATDLAMDSGS